jgi:hypothetical protein
VSRGAAAGKELAGSRVKVWLARAGVSDLVESRPKD